MILMLAIPLRRPLERVGPEMATSEASAILAQKIGTKWIYFVPVPPPPASIQAFVQKNLEINSDMNTKCMRKIRLQHIKRNFTPEKVHKKVMRKREIYLQYQYAI